MAKKNYLPGDRFGNLTVVREAGRDRWMQVLWECRCDCGAICTKPSGILKRDQTCSLACPIRRAKVGEKNRKHGLVGRPIYFVWQSFVARCTNPNHRSWKNYGGRGITVCEEWRAFENFYRDMSSGYAPGLQIDRINNNAGYYKENCR